MATVTQKLITAEEFLLMPDPTDGTRLELVRGEIISMAQPGVLHGVCCLKVGRRIGNYADERDQGIVASNDSGIITERDPDTVRGPDIAYWSKGKLKEIPVGYADIAPDLAVEVLSPSNTSKQIRAKLQEYFAKGVRMVWVVAPEDRFVTVYRSPDEGKVFHEKATISGEDVLPGFECKVADLLP